MSNLATIVNNILADSGIDDINVVVTTGSYSNPAWITALSWTKITDRPTTLGGYGITDAYTQTQVNNLLANYVPYSGATSSVNLGIYTLSSSNLIANGGFNSGSLMLKPGTGAQTINLDYFTLTPSGTTSINFGFSTGASTWKSFSFSSVLLTNNTPTIFTLPNGGGTIAVVGGSGVGTVTSVAALTLGTSGTDLSSSVANGTTTPVITLNVPTASAANRGALSAADWTTFNNKQNALTNPVTGTGTTNYLPKFTGTSTIGNSQIFDNGTTVFVNAITAPALGSPKFLVKMATANSYEGILVASSSNNNVIAIAHTGSIGLITTNYGTSGSNTPLAFGTDGVGQMTLATSGNLGLGVTPSAWSLGKAIEIGNIGNSVWGVNTTQFNVLQNVYYDGGGFKYATSNAASYYQQASGAHAWYNAPSGTAGNAISFTQAMTLGSNSGLSIGTPSAAPSQGLLVQGASTLSGLLTVNGGAEITSNASTVGLKVFGGGNLNIDYLQVGYSGGSASPIFRIAYNGAATFSSSVTATQFTAQSDSAYYRVRRGAGTDVGYITDSSTWGDSGTDFTIGASSANLRFYVNNNTIERMRLFSGGQLVVGGTTVGYSGTKLQVGNTSDSQNGLNILTSTTGYGYILFGDGAGADTYVGQISYFHTDNSMAFQTNGSEAMRIFSSRNVHIGPTPSSDNGARLQVSGTATVSGGGRVLQVTSSYDAVPAVIRSTNGAVSTLSFQGTTSSNDYNTRIGCDANDLIAYTSNLIRLRINSSGAATFSSSVTATGGLISNGGSIGYGGGELGFNVTTSGATSGIYTTATGSPILYFDHRATGNTGFWVWRSGTGGATTALTLSNAGAATFSSSVSVGGAGINTDFTIYRTVAPNVYFSISAPGGSPNTSFLGVNGTDVMGLTATANVLIGTTTDSGQKLQVSGNIKVGDGGGASLINFNASSYGALQIGGSTKLTVNTGVSVGSSYGTTAAPSDGMIIQGNVGIGTTADNGYKLHVNGSGAGLYVVGANSAPFTQTIASFVYGGNGNSIDIENQGGKASIQGRVGTSAMTLHLNPAGGNVLIGTATDDNTFKLQVNGSARFENAVQINGGSFTVRQNNVPQQSILLDLIPTDGRIISTLRFGARWNSTTYGIGASIDTYAAGAWSSTNYGSNIVFSTVTQNTDVNSTRLTIAASGTVTINNLAGTGTRMVVANASGVLSTQAITAGTVTSVTASSPLFSSGGATPNITIQQASSSQNGFLSSTDWTTFNNKVSGSGSAGQVAYWSSGSAITGESNLFWDATNDRLGIGVASPTAKLDINGDIRTSAPTGTNNEFWKLGRALLATSADPEDRWIRVQLGTKIYDILAIDRGNA
jgi:hypothetical protein